MEYISLVNIFRTYPILYDVLKAITILIIIAKNVLGHKMFSFFSKKALSFLLTIREFKQRKMIKKS